MFLSGRPTERQIDHVIQIRLYFLLDLDPNGLQRLPADDKNKGTDFVWAGNLTDSKVLTIFRLFS